MSSGLGLRGLQWFNVVARGAIAASLYWTKEAAPKQTVAGTFVARELSKPSGLPDTGCDACFRSRFALFVSSR